jgi:hypothetical protein
MKRTYGRTPTEIINTVKIMPGLTANEIAKLIPDVKYSTVLSTISNLAKQGVLVNAGYATITKSNGLQVKASKFNYNDNPVPLPVKRKLKAPTPTGYEAQISKLKAQIAELEAWKEVAVTRYPDLAVPPIVLRARTLVAEEVAAGGDFTLADQIRRGLKDTTLMVRVAIKALEE